MQTMATRPAPPAERYDCRPPEHPRLTAFLEAMAMAGALWDATGALTTQALRRQIDDRCHSAERDAR